jgi:hypothetical protein
MIRQGTSRDTYTGKAGQMAVQAELLARQCNVAVPEVDEGEDVFTFVFREPDVTRIQVKTATAERLQEARRYAAKVSVPLEQLHDDGHMELYYVFAIRLDNLWVNVVSRTELNAWSTDGGMGYVNLRARELQLYLSFSPDALVCSGRDLQPYRNAWERLPILHPSSSGKA